MSNKKRDPQQLERIETAMQMYAEGKSYGQIAKAIGGVRSGAYAMIQRELARREAAPVEATRAALHRDAQLVALDAAITKVMPLVHQGDLKAIDTMLELMDRQAKIIGLYPDESEATK